MKRKPFTPTKHRRRVFSQLWMLALQFLLGMILNVIGSPAPQHVRVLYDVVLILHVVNAIGLLEGALYIALKAPSKLSWSGMTAIALTFTSGIVALATNANAWSLIMACGFLVSGWLYVMLYIRADRLARLIARSE